MTESTRPDDPRDEVPDDLKDRLDELGEHLVEEAPERGGGSRDPAPDDESERGDR